MKQVVIFAILLAAVVCAGCGSSKLLAEEPVSLGSDITVSVQPGDHYRHRLRIMPLISIRNPPQMAVWLESPDGAYLETILITQKAGEQSWRRAPGDDDTNGEIRRPEALPVWSSRAPESGGSTLDSTTSATPKDDFDVTKSVPDNREFVVWLEVNHSTDFNSAYPEDARPGEAGYSGGPWGSGQPSLVYRAVLGGTPGQNSVVLTLVGHGSPDGSDGLVHEDLAGITDAMDIIDSAMATLGTVNW